MFTSVQSNMLSSERKTQACNLNFLPHICAYSSDRQSPLRAERHHNVHTVNQNEPPTHLQYGPGKVDITEIPCLSNTLARVKLWPCTQCSCLPTASCSDKGSRRRRCKYLGEFASCRTDTSAPGMPISHQNKQLASPCTTPQMLNTKRACPAGLTPVQAFRKATDTSAIFQTEGCSAFTSC